MEAKGAVEEDVEPEAKHLPGGWATALMDPTGAIAPVGATQGGAAYYKQRLEKANEVPGEALVCALPNPLPKHLWCG